MYHQCKIGFGWFTSEKDFEKKLRYQYLNWYAKGSGVRYQYLTWYAKGGQFHEYFQGTQMTQSEGLKFVFAFVTTKYIL